MFILIRSQKINEWPAWVNSMEEQPPRHPKVKGSSLAGTGREK